MYEAFFGLRSRPFNPLPRVDSYVALSPMREALDSLTSCIEQDRGIGVLTSPAGTGKSLVCRRLQALFADQRRVVLLTTGRFPTRRALLQAILFEMKHPYVGLSEQEARLRLLDLLQSSPAPSNRLLLIVDEAHLLSPKGHEELRTLTDYEQDGVPSVSLVLSGQLELEEALAEPTMNALNQRVGCHVTLEPLTHEESAIFIRERLRLAGNDGLTIFTPEAIQAICSASEGNPRRLNQLCDHCLLLAYAEGTRPVDASLVRSALLDLRELPLHWNSPVDLGEADLGKSTATNSLEAYAEAHSQVIAESEGEIDFADSEDFAPVDMTIDQVCSDEVESAPSVFEVGSDSSGDAIDQLFQTSHFIVPSDFQSATESFSQILKSSEAEESDATGVYETSPEPEREHSLSEECSSPVENFESELTNIETNDVSDSMIIHEPGKVSPEIPPVMEEFEIDDTYAQIDRKQESGLPPRLMTSLLHQMASDIAPTASVEETSEAKDHSEVPSVDVQSEEHLLSLVREMSESIQQARALASQPGEDQTETEKLSQIVTRCTPYHHPSLREALSWQFDVVEPESETPSDTPEIPHPASAKSVSDNSQPESDSSEQLIQERRYSQLFTRLQKQRRRVETVLNREKRSTGEARLS